MGQNEIEQYIETHPSLRYEVGNNDNCPGGFEQDSLEQSFPTGGFEQDSLEQSFPSIGQYDIEQYLEQHPSLRYEVEDNDYCPGGFEQDSLEQSFPSIGQNDIEQYLETHPSLRYEVGDNDYQSNFEDDSLEGEPFEEGYNAQDVPFSSMNGGNIYDARDLEQNALEGNLEQNENEFEQNANEPVQNCSQEERSLYDESWSDPRDFAGSNPPPPLAPVGRGLRTWGQPALGNAGGINIRYVDRGDSISDDDLTSELPDYSFPVFGVPTTPPVPAATSTPVHSPIRDAAGEIDSFEMEGDSLDRSGVNSIVDLLQEVVDIIEGDLVRMQQEQLSRQNTVGGNTYDAGDFNQNALGGNIEPDSSDQDSLEQFEPDSLDQDSLEQFEPDSLDQDSLEQFEPDSLDQDSLEQYEDELEEDANEPVQDCPEEEFDDSLNYDESWLDPRDLARSDPPPPSEPAPVGQGARTWGQPARGHARGRLSPIREATEEIDSFELEGDSLDESLISSIMDSLEEVVDIIEGDLARKQQELSRGNNC